MTCCVFEEALKKNVSLQSHVLKQNHQPQSGTYLLAGEGEARGGPLEICASGGGSAAPTAVQPALRAAVREEEEKSLTQNHQGGKYSKQWHFENIFWTLRNIYISRVADNMWVSYFNVRNGRTLLRMCFLAKCARWFLSLSHLCLSMQCVPPSNEISLSFHCIRFRYTSNI